MDCIRCGAPVVDRDDGFCTDHCRYGHLVRRRDDIMAKRDRISKAREIGRGPVPEELRGVCLWCGASFGVSWNMRYCTPGCKHLANEARKAPKAGYWAKVKGDRDLGQRCGHRHRSEKAAKGCKVIPRGRAKYFEN